MEDLAKKLKRLVVSKIRKRTIVVDDENYLEGDFLDSTIEEHRECNDDEGFVSLTGDENHLADNFFDGDSYIQKVFLGLYGGDGINRTAYNVIGFSFRSTEFVFLYKFLVRCGVKAPNLGFYVNSSREPDRFRAGYHAAVKWEYTSEGIANIRFNHGFPSSRLYKSDSQKMNAFLCKEGDRNFILAFFLGWFMADGTIKWNWSGNIQARRIKYVCAEISSKDEDIILWFQNRLTAINVEVEVYKDSKNQTILKILNRPQSGNKVILEAIQLLRSQAIPMNGKLLWWNKFLTSKDGLLAEETAPPRSKSFFEYLGQDAILHHPLACLIGQDLYALNLDQLNLILAFCEYPVVRSTYDLDIVDFSAFIANFICRVDLTSQQFLFINYYKCCKKRLTANFRIMDFQYKKAFLECEVCQQVFVQLVNLNRHLLLEHSYDLPDDRVECKICYKKLNTVSSLKSHIKHIHEYDGRTYKCEIDACEKQYKYKSSLNQHQIIKHNPDGPLYYSCIVDDCTKVYATSSGLSRHRKYIHENHPRKVYYCGLDGCLKSYLDQKSWLWHIYSKHLNDD